MANATSTLTVRMLDQVSGPAAAAAASLQRLTGAATRLNAAGNVGGFAGAFTRMAGHIEAAQRRLDRFAEALRGLSMPIAIGGGFLARDLIEFSRLGNQLEAFGQATKAQREELERYAHSLDAIFGAFKYTDVLKGFTEMMKQGLKPEQIMGGAGRAILAFAQASGITPDDATKYLLTGVTATGMPRGTPEELQRSITRLSDIISSVADATHLSAHTVGDAIRFAAPAGAAVGMSPEQMGALTRALAEAGFQGSEIGVAERSMIVSLIRGGRKQQEAFARLGIDRSEFIRGGRELTADGVVSTLGIGGVNATAFKDQIAALLANRDLDPSQLIARITDTLVTGGAGDDRTAISEAVSRALASSSGMTIDIMGLLRRIRERGGEAELVNIFEGRQFPKMAQLLKSDIEKFFQELQAAAQSGSVTADKAAKMNQGLSAAWDKFVSSIQNLEDALGKSGLNTLFAGILNGLSSLLDKISNTNPYVLFTGALVALGTAALAAVAKMMALSLAIARLGAAATVGTAGTALGTGTALAAGGAAGTASRLAAGARLGLWGLGATGVTIGLGAALDAADAQTRAWEQANPGLAGRIRRGEMMFSLPPPAPTPAPDRLPSVSDFVADLQSGNLNGAGASAGQGAGQAFSSAFTDSARGATAGAELLLREWAQSLNLNVTITPRLDMSGLNGIHADTGISATGR